MSDARNTNRPEDAMDNHRIFLAKRSLAEYINATEIARVTAANAYVSAHSSQCSEGRRLRALLLEALGAMLSIVDHPQLITAGR